MEDGEGDDEAVWPVPDCLTGLCVVVVGDAAAGLVADLPPLAVVVRGQAGAGGGTGDGRGSQGLDGTGRGGYALRGDVHEVADGGVPGDLAGGGAGEEGGLGLDPGAGHAQDTAGASRTTHLRIDEGDPEVGAPLGLVRPTPAHALRRAQRGGGDGGDGGAVDVHLRGRRRCG